MLKLLTVSQKLELLLHYWLKVPIIHKLKYAGNKILSFSILNLNSTRVAEISTNTGFLLIFPKLRPSKALKCEKMVFAILTVICPCRQPLQCPYSIWSPRPWQTCPLRSHSSLCVCDAAPGKTVGTLMLLYVGTWIPRALAISSPDSGCLSLASSRKWAQPLLLLNSLNFFADVYHHFRA